MAREGKGWISLHRSIQEHWLWQEKPFSKGQAWLDLLLSANHQDKKILLGNELISVKRGSFITSQKKLMERWGWGSEKTRAFLKLLDSDGMIKFQPDKKKTTIIILNYDRYQNQNGLNADIPTDSENMQNDNRTQTECNQNDSRTSAETNNNDNNDNNDNKYINNKEKEELNPIKVYQNNIFPTPGFIEIEGIQKWSNDLGSELVIQAIEIAAKNNARNWKYIERILMDWNNNGIKTIEQAKAYSKTRGGKKVGSTRQNNKKPKPKQEGEGEKLARRALEKYGDKLEDFECDF
ncbi:DnaD domain-containing protein [Clostridium cochlearium]|uniref:Phage protein n=1 Tax=Clostridium cochlearium TaxID=1494 RepID=A0A2X2WD42_CLOCO|nr:DnaD domain protein [Clostridium cochlearium]SQB33975.1 phage protein [Clostridium cochlearium]